MTDYNVIYQQMEDGREYTAKDLGVAPASMTAMVRRGLVSVSFNGSPKRYTRNAENISVWICEVVGSHLPKDKEFFIVHKEGEQYGMMCSIKNNVVRDCWNNVYDLTDVTSVEINHQLYTK